MERQICLSRFTCARFIELGKGLLRSFHTEKNLFYYESNGSLAVNNEIAGKIAFEGIADFDRHYAARPILGKDQGTGASFEGIILFFGNISYNVILTYDEFVSLLKYLDKFDFDGMALKLLSVGLAASTGGTIKAPPVTEPTTTPETGTWSPEKQGIMPKI